MKCYSVCPPIWCHHNGFPLSFITRYPCSKHPYHCEYSRQKPVVRKADFWEMEIICALLGRNFDILGMELLLLHNSHIAILSHWCRDQMVIESYRARIQEIQLPRISLDFCLDLRGSCLASDCRHGISSQAAFWKDYKRLSEQYLALPYHAHTSD